MTNAETLLKEVWATLGPSKIHGIGVIAIRDIPAGTEIAKQSFSHYDLSAEEFLKLDQSIRDIILDRTQQAKDQRIKFPHPNLSANLQSFMNHAEDPNSDGLRTLRDIKQHEEITEHFLQIADGDLHELTLNRYLKENIIMKSITIFTTFFDASPAYSLNQCVQDQIRMLIYGGYKPNVIVVDGFVAKEMYAHPDVTLKYIPGFPINNDGTLPPNYEEYVNETRDLLLEHFKDTDIVITHDVIYQPAHLIHNLASRQVAEMMPKLRWLHWIHSATSPEILCSVEAVRPIIKQSFPNSFICYPNFYDIPRVAENYGYEEDMIKWVPHPIDVGEYLGVHELTKQLIRQKDLLTADVLAAYPIRLDRGKQVENVIKVLASMKKRGRSVKLVVMDFHSTGGDKVAYRDELKDIAVKWNVLDETTFLSEFHPALQYDSPRAMVRDMMLLSNLYIHPSVSETYSLAVQEAALCKNQLVLNRDFPPMMSLYGQWPLYKQFSSNINAITGRNGDTMWNWKNGERMPYPENEVEYFDEMASNILYYLESNPVLQENKFIRQERSIEHVFTKYLFPLLHGE